MRKQAGFSAVELLIIVLVLGILGFVSYGVYNRLGGDTSGDSATTTSESAKADDVASAPDVDSTEDLDTALTTLDKTDPSGSNSSDTSELDSELAAF